MEPSAAIPGLYERHADAFDRTRGKTLFEKPWLDRFCAGLSPDAALLDLGCGTGEPIAADLVRRGYRVTGIDTSSRMIALCKARLPTAEWHVGDMRHIALGRTFEGIIAWHSFFHLTADDQRRMFAIFSKHLRADGALMFTSGSKAGVAIGVFEGEALFHESLASRAYRELLDENGFTVVEHVRDDRTCGGATVWLATRRL
ncbi:class I SAM-dependent DNA methyltransferase [Rhizobium halophytocola]|uniref:SAM-dependent methyltransferase n=1 Tax=Rhizobium halophytocola TaxID=735519 RepID=A0ABS4DXP6_9HYPH|nr:class I SAM-dependent methyltransferase [Rhizobium halophytocola]MBP1850468.1 SAM-dependent methyltransferase [Rhizobium halophytocola]